MYEEETSGLDRLGAGRSSLCTATSEPFKIGSVSRSRSVTEILVREFQNMEPVMRQLNGIGCCGVQGNDESNSKATCQLLVT